MEQIITQILESGLTWQTARPLIQFLIILFVGMAVKDWMQNSVSRYFAHKRIIGHPHLKVLSFIRFANPYEYLNGQIIEINNRRVVTETKYTFEHVPILEFDKMQKSIMKVEPVNPVELGK